MLLKIAQRREGRLWDTPFCAPQPAKEEDNDRFYEVNPLLDSQPGGKINTELSFLSYISQREGGGGGYL